MEAVDRVGVMHSFMRRVQPSQLNFTRSKISAFISPPEIGVDPHKRPVLVNMPSKAEKQPGVTRRAPLRSAAEVLCRLRFRFCTIREWTLCDYEQHWSAGWLPDSFHFCPLPRASKCPRWRAPGSFSYTGGAMLNKDVQIMAVRNNSGNSDFYWQTWDGKTW